MNKAVVLALVVELLGCAELMPHPAPIPTVTCGGTTWQTARLYTFSCNNVVKALGAADFVPAEGLVHAATLALLAEADYFYLDASSYDPVHGKLTLRAAAIAAGTAAPPGKTVLFVGQYLSPGDVMAARMAGREIRCENALGNPSAPAEEQQSCGQFLAWREQVRAREAQEQIQRDQVAAQERLDDQLRRERMAAALQQISNTMAAQQQQNAEERRHQELMLQLQSRQPAPPVQTNCRTDVLGIHCTSQ